MILHFSYVYVCRSGVDHNFAMKHEMYILNDKFPEISVSVFLDSYRVFQEQSGVSEERFLG